MNRIRRSSQINETGPGELEDDDMLELLMLDELLTEELLIEELLSDELEDTLDDESELLDDTDDDDSELELLTDELEMLDDDETLDELIEELEDTLDEETELGDEDELTSSTTGSPAMTILGTRRKYGIRANERAYDWPKR